MYYDFTGLPVIIENTQFCTIILLRSLGIQYDNIPRPGQYTSKEAQACFTIYWYNQRYAFCLYVLLV